MTLKHVHIDPQGDKFCLRTGLFHTFEGWQAAEAAKLPVETRREDGTVVWNCLDNLTKRKAEELAVKLDAWLESLEQNSWHKPRRNARAEAAAEKYQQAMEGR